MAIHALHGIPLSVLAGLNFHEPRKRIYHRIFKSQVSPLAEDSLDLAHANALQVVRQRRAIAFDGHHLTSRVTAGIRVRHANVHVRYLPAPERLSHFICQLVKKEHPHALVGNAFARQPIHPQPFPYVVNHTHMFNCIHFLLAVPVLLTPLATFVPKKHQAAECASHALPPLNISPPDQNLNSCR